MVVDDIQQKSQEEHKGGLDEILHFGDSSLEAKMEYFREFVNDLGLALAEYIRWNDERTSCFSKWRNWRNQYGFEWNCIFKRTNT